MCPALICVARLHCRDGGVRDESMLSSYVTCELVSIVIGGFIFCFATPQVFHGRTFIPLASVSDSVPILSCGGIAKT